MALVLTRRAGEELLLKLESDISESELQQLMTDGVQIRIARIDGQQAKISIHAPPAVSIMRTELLEAIPPHGQGDTGS
ncbi:carbon storage regulator [Ectopseudomonas mendocina]|uniref:carbon storage regulator n=1 Tax=Ectopseudomonas mendocina TaxID=300 RepID=UPI00376EAEC7